MSGNNVLSIVMSVIIYAFLGYLVITLFIGVFPLLAVLLLIGLAIYAVSSIINRLRFGIGQSQAKRKFDEFGNRKTNATVIGMEESQPSDPEIAKATPDKKDDKE